MWTGSAWVSPFGQTLLRTTNFTSQTSVAFDNVFSSEFRNYKIVINAIGSGAAALLARVRTGGTSVTSSTYIYQNVDINNTTVSASRASTTFWAVSTLRSTRHGLVDLTIGNPFTTLSTTMLANAFDVAGVVQFNYAENTNLTSYDGIEFYPQSGNMTGSISIYGMRV
jgi:hypothetical protein